MYLLWLYCSSNAFVVQTPVHDFTKSTILLAAETEIYEQICHTFDLNLEDPDIESVQHVAQELETDLQDYDVYSGDVGIVFNEELDDSSEVQDVPAPENTRYKNMSEKRRIDIYEALLTHSTNGKLKRNSTTVVAQMFNEKLYNVQAVWRRVKE